MYDRMASIRLATVGKIISLSISNINSVLDSYSSLYIFSSKRSSISLSCETRFVIPVNVDDDAVARVVADVDRRRLLPDFNVEWHMSNSGIVQPYTQHKVHSFVADKGRGI